MASEVTQLLAQHRNGDTQALEALASLIYPELKAMARRRTAGKHDPGATTLVNETFIKLLEGGVLKPKDQRQFFGLSATIMRRLIVDEVRYACAQKRAAPAVTLVDEHLPDDGRDSGEFLLQVEQMLQQLELEDEQLVRVFECRYFAGFTTVETAETLDLSERSVERLWSKARSRIAELLDDSAR